MAVTQTQDPAELAAMQRRVAELRLEHRDLDEAIARLQQDIEADELAVKRLKKRKLLLKDQIASSRSRCSIRNSATRRCIAASSAGSWVWVTTPA